MRSAVADAKIPHAGSTVAPMVTVSLGIATGSSTKSASPWDLVKRADEALYAAKSGGRNRCVQV